MPDKVYSNEAHSDGDFPESMYAVQEPMTALFMHLAQVEMLSKAKEYANELKEIDGMVMKKIATIAKVSYIATCILNGTEVQRQKDIEQGLAAK